MNVIKFFSSALSNLWAENNLNMQFGLGIILPKYAFADHLQALYRTR